MGDSLYLLLQCTFISAAEIVGCVELVVFYVLARLDTCNRTHRVCMDHKQQGGKHERQKNGPANTWLTTTNANTNIDANTRPLLDSLL